MGGDEGFFARWSKRKRGVAEAPPPAAPTPPLPVPPAVPAVELSPPAAGDLAADAPAEPPPPPPTLDDVARLPSGADVARFVARDVDPVVKNAALKKLFADPHFNVMDGLDVYIDDYGKPDPLPAPMLRRMAASQLLGLFREEEQSAPRPAADNAPPPLPAAAAAPTPTAEPALPTHEDPAVQLQPDDAAGPRGAGAGADPDPRREP